MIRGDALGGALIEGWCGPIESYIDDCAALRGWHPMALVGPDRRRPGRWLAFWASENTHDDITCSSGGIRLDPTRPEVQHRVSDVLRSLGHEVGHLLPVALGGRVGDAVEETTCSACGGDGRRKAPNLDDEPCPFCSGAGTSRRPVPAARVSARLLAASIEGVEAGRGVIKELWRIDAVLDIGGRCYQLVRVSPNDTAFTVVSDLADLVRIANVALLDPTARDGVRVPGEVDG